MWEYMYTGELYHHGIKGQKWGVRRYQNKDGTLTKAGRKRYAYSSTDNVFISGKTKYDRPIDKNIRKQIDEIIKAGSKIHIGDAPGADKRVQDYLASKRYKNVEVYTTDPAVRNNVGNWKVNTVSSNGKRTERTIRRQKDVAMTRVSNKGLAIAPSDDRKRSATSLNVKRLRRGRKPVMVYNYDLQKYIYR